MRNSLALALALKDETGIAAIACDTDGIDGSEDNAGAWFDGSLFDEARSKGVDLAAHLETNIYGLRAARQAHRDRPDAHQRQRFPLHSHSFVKAGCGLRWSS